jgi:signal transduction histidine kinase
MARESPEGRQVFLSTLVAGRGERRFAVAVVLVSAAVFIFAVPMAKVPLSPVWAFIPVYQSALVVNDLITAVLLFGQFAILRSRALLVLASGYLFTAVMAAAHALTFPGLFSPSGLLGAGPQTTAWLYMFWHGGFPLWVGAYALLKADGARTSPGWHPGVAILSAGAAVLAAVSALTLLATWEQQALPAIMQGNRYTALMITVVSSVWALSLLALGLLWRRRPHSVLDVWLMVVMSAWLFDIALAAVLNAGRFDLGFYAGRIYGLLAASFVLLVLLIEHGRLYARLAAAHASERRERQLVQLRTAELTAVNKDLEAFSYSVSHDLRAPLRAVQGYVTILEEDFGERMEVEARRLLGVIQDRARQMEQLIEDLLVFARLGRQPLAVAAVRLDELVTQTLDDLRSTCEGRQIQFTVGRLGTVQADPAMLKQVLANLFGNAIKFTRHRKPAAVEVGCRADADGASVYYVKDNGAGFDMRQADKLFGVFQRLHSAAEYEGTGVGLAIVQRVIERHGGRVWAESSPGEGATFYFTLLAASPDHRGSGRLDHESDQQSQGREEVTA